MTTLGPVSRDDLNNFIVSSSANIQYGFMTGFLLGGFSAGQRASLQFLAENQHEMPKTRAQALMYHRNKNYKMMAAFASAGSKRGLQLATVAAAYSAIKKSIQVARLQNYSFIPIHPHLDDLFTSTIVGGSFFLLSNRKHQRLFHLKKGILLGSAFGATLSLLKYCNHLFFESKTQSHSQTLQ